MGWSNVVVLNNDLSEGDLVKGDRQSNFFGLSEVNTDLVTPKQLERLLAAGDTAVIDLATSRAYRESHIPGSWFAVRSRFAGNLAKIPKSSGVIITSNEGILAQLAAADAAAYLDAPISVLDGGTSAWKAAGLPISVGFENLADETDDVYWRPHEGVGDEESAMREYLDWETDLIDQVELDGTAQFKTFPQ
jgi:3-mercaptopyruvate sulfurtransferase SseA